MKRRDVLTGMGAIPEVIDVLADVIDFATSSATGSGEIEGKVNLNR